MGKIIHKYNEFKLLLEREEDSEVDFSEFDLEEEPGSDEIGTELENTNDNPISDSEGEEEEEETQLNIDRVFNEDPSYYIREALEKVKRRILSLFEEPNPDKKGRLNRDPSSYYNQGVELLDVRITDLSMNKTLIIKYHDNDFSYHLMITVDLKQGIPDKPDIEMDYSMVEFGGVKFKKYDPSNNLLGQLDRKKVPLKTIDQDFIDSLNGELDSKYSIGDDFEIEYGEDN